jgi:hypothetical protein
MQNLPHGLNYVKFVNTQIETYVFGIDLELKIKYEMELFINTIPCSSHL